MENTSVLEQEQVATSQPKDKEEIIFNEPIRYNSSFDVKPVSPPVEISTNPTHERDIEYKLAQMAGTSDFDTLQESSVANEYNKLNAAVVSATRESKFTREDFINLTTAIANKQPINKKTNGEAFADKVVRDPIVDVRRELANAVDVDTTRRIIRDQQNKNLNLAPGTASRKQHNPAALATAIQVSAKSKVAAKRLEELGEGEFSLEKTLEFFNPIGGEDPEGMDIEVWQSAKDIVSGDFDYADFNTRMESNYGEDWEWRFGGWLAKEALIDAGILILALSPASPIAFALKAGQTTLRAKAGAALARSAVIAVGGGTAQATQNVIIDRDANLGMEMGLRFGGALVGEAVVKGVGAGVRRLYGRTARDAAKEAAKKGKTKLQSNATMKAAFADVSPVDSPLAAVARANMISAVNDYDKIVHSTASQWLDIKRADEKMRLAVADVVGKEVEELDQVATDVLFSHAIRQNKKLIKESTARIKNQTGTSQALSYDLMALIGGEFENFSRKAQLFVTDNGLALREMADGISASNGGLLAQMMKGMGVAENVEFGLQSATNLLDAKNYSANVARGLTRLYKDATKGLSTKDKKRLSDILSEGSHNTTVYDFETIHPVLDLPDGQVLSQGVKEAYAKVRFTLDVAHGVMDQARVAALKGRVAKYGRGFVQRVDNKPPTKDGFIKVREFDPHTMQAKPDGKVKKIKMATFEKNGLESIVPYRNGHVPRVYDNKRFLVGVSQPEKGLLSVEASFNNRFEAEKWARERTATGLSKGEEVIHLTDNLDTGAQGFSGSRNLHDLIASAPKEARAGLEAALKGAGIRTDLAKIMTRIDPGSPSGPGFEKARTDLGIASTKKLQELRLTYLKSKTKESRDAARLAIEEELRNVTKPTETSVVEYFHILSQNAGASTWQRFAVDDWIARFGKDILPNSSWANPEFKVGVAAVDQNAAREYGKFIQRYLGKKSIIERGWDNTLISWRNTLATKAGDGNLAARGALKVVTAVPLAKTVESMMRFSAAAPKLLFWNIPHFFIQFSQVVPTMGAAMLRNPKTAIVGISKLPRVFNIMGHVAAGKPVTRRMRQSDAFKAYEDLMKSGYTADLNTNDVAFNMGSWLDPSTGGIIARSTKTALRFTGRAGQAPFKVGEASNRISAFMVVREQTIDALRKGSLDIQFGKKVLTEADIGSAEFRQFLVDRAKVLALDMGKAGELKALSAERSVLFQFKQVLPKQISMFTTKTLSAREKVGAGLAMTAFWGLGGVPLAVDIWGGLNWAFSSSDDPSSLKSLDDKGNEWLATMSESLSDWTDNAVEAETIQRLIKKGGLAAATDGEIDIVSRVALGSFLTDMVDIEDPFDFIVSVAIIGDAIEASKRIAGVDLRILNPQSWAEMKLSILEGRTFQEALAEQYMDNTTLGKLIMGDKDLGASVLEIARESGKVFSQVGALSRVMDARYRDVVNPDYHFKNPWTPEYYSTSSLRGTSVERNTTRDVLQLLGFTPGKVVETHEKEDLERSFKKAYATYTKDTEDKLRLLIGSGSRTYIRQIEEYVRVIEHFRQYVKAKGYDISVVKNPRKQALDMLRKVNTDWKSGGQIK